MKLARAARYFSGSGLEYWGGTAWVPLPGETVTLILSDKFVGSREESMLRRYGVFDTHSTVPSMYSILRVDGDDGLIFLVGELFLDTRKTEGVYALTALLYLASTQAVRVRMVTTNAASGVASSVTEDLSQPFFINVLRSSDHVSDLKTANQILEVDLILPRDADVLMGDIVRSGRTDYEVFQVYNASGLLHARATVHG